MSWHYALTESPITHDSGTVPIRPLAPGDTVNFLNGVSARLVATTETLLMTEFGRILFRAPVEGDFSQVITAREE